LLTTGMQMLLGGAMLLALGTGAGEWGRVDVAAISLKSVLALLYLLFFGAIVGFTAYTYLLQNTTPTRASTYAFVNPGVAVFLGWLFAGEPVTPRVILAALTIIGAVVLITSHQGTTTGEFPVVGSAPPKVPARRAPTETSAIG
jgi:drug/metabolite transporter (DMT)-like permease